MFSINKSAQIICFLLRKSGCCMNPLKLMNLLYLCDRESMNIYDEPITNDEWFSTNDGFILSKTNDLINSDNKWFYIRGENCLALKHINNYDFTDISRSDIKIIGRIYNKFIDYDNEQIKNYIIKNCKEWIKPSDKLKKISKKDLFKRLGRSREQLKMLHDWDMELNSIDTSSSLMR